MSAFPKGLIKDHPPADDVIVFEDDPIGTDPIAEDTPPIEAMSSTELVVWLTILVTSVVVMSWSISVLKAAL